MPLPTLRQLALGAIAALGAASLTSGCAWQTYAAMRATRHVTGAKMHEHVIRPLASSLRGYRVIELRQFTNMLPGRVPASMEQYLGDRVASGLSGLPAAPAVARMTALDVEVAAASPAPDAQPTLVIEGFLDDYDAGSRALRIVELGFNHVAVTARAQLRDKQSNILLGGISITAEDDRETGTTKQAIERVAGRIDRFVEGGYAR